MAAQMVKELGRKVLSLATQMVLVRDYVLGGKMDVQMVTGMASRLGMV